MTEKDLKEQKLVNVISKHLNTQTEEVSDELDRALNLRRQHALDKAENGSTTFTGLSSFIIKPVPLSALATACLLVVVFISLNQSQNPDTELNGSLNELADLELLMTEDNLEFYEDLEFYQWLVLEETHSS